MSQETEAARLFADGMSVNAVAKKLGVSWFVAKGMKPLTDNPEATETEVEALVWPIALEIPVDDLDDIINYLTEDELRDGVQDLGGDQKALIVQTVLQKQLNKSRRIKLKKPPASAEPETIRLVDAG